MSVFLLAGMVFVFLFCGTILILSQHPIKLVLGLSLLSHAFNLIIFGTTRLTDGSEPIVDISRVTDPIYWAETSFADPLPHALILTAVVIGFGLTAYLIALLQRLHEIEPETENGSEKHRGRLTYLSVEHFDPSSQSVPEDFLQLDEVPPVQSVPKG